MSILLYDSFTTLDIVGSYESLAGIPNMQTEHLRQTDTSPLIWESLSILSDRRTL